MLVGIDELGGLERAQDMVDDGAVATDLPQGTVRRQLGDEVELDAAEIQELGEQLLAAKERAPRSPAQPSALKKTIDAVIS